MPSYKKFTKDVGLVGITELAIALKGLIVMPIITKLLGPQNFGVWSQLVVTIALIAPLATLGLPYAMVRFLAAEKNKDKFRDGVWSVVAIVFCVALAVCLLIAAFSTPIAKFFGGDQILVQILALAIVIECLNQVLFNVFRTLQEIGRYSFFTALQVFGEVGLVSSLILSGNGLTGATFSLLAIRLVVFIIMGTTIIFKIGIKLPAFTQLKDYLFFSLPNLISGIAFWIVQSSNRYLIGFFSGAIAVGYFVPAYTIGNIIALFFAPLSFILPAILSKLYDENKIDAVKFYLKYSLKYFLAIAIPAIVGLSSLSRQLLERFSTAEIADKAYYVVLPVAIGTAFYGIYNIFVQILVLCKQTKAVGAIWSKAALLSLVASLLFIPRFGIMGAATALLAAFTYSLIATGKLAFENFRFDIDGLFIIKSLASSALMTPLIFWLDPSGLLDTVATIALGAAAYFISIFLMRGFDKKEISFLKTLIIEQAS